MHSTASLICAGVSGTVRVTMKGLLNHVYIGQCVSREVIQTARSTGFEALRNSKSRGGYSEQKSDGSEIVGHVGGVGGW